MSDATRSPGPRELPDLGRVGTLPGPGRPAGGLTLIELMVAMFITTLIGLLVYGMYASAIDSTNRMEKGLRALQGFCSATDRIERDLAGICCKAGYVAWAKRERYDNGQYAGWWYDDTYPMQARFKPIHRSMLRIHFRNRYMGFYTSNDNRRIDRVEYYFNPPEPRHRWADGVDDDGDDPGDGLNLLVDDKGSLMVRETRDSLPGGAVPNPHLQFEDYAKEPGDFRDGWGPPPWLVGGDILDEHFRGGTIDDGEILADGIRDVQFFYLYSTSDSPALQSVHCWPYVGDPGEGDAVAGGPFPYVSGGGWDGVHTDRTGLKWPATDHGRDGIDSVRPFGRARLDNAKGLSFMTLPQAVQVDCRFDMGAREERRLSRTIYLHASKWRELLTREAPAHMR